MGMSGAVYTTRDIIILYILARAHRGHTRGTGAKPGIQGPPGRQRSRQEYRGHTKGTEATQVYKGTGASTGIKRPHPQGYRGHSRGTGATQG